VGLVVPADGLVIFPEVPRGRDMYETWIVVEYMQYGTKAAHPLEA
jgi:hypothetical protein